MADRLTQLQDCINQVILFGIIFFCYYLYLLCSKQNTFATALEYYNSSPLLANSLALTGVVRRHHSNKPKKTTSSCLQLSSHGAQKTSTLW